jgi:hypothetical protein
MNDSAANGKQSAQHIQKLVNELKEAQAKIKDLEAQLSATKAARTELETITIPDYMFELKISQISLMSGDAVSVKPFYYARLPETPSERDTFFDWLNANGHRGLVKDKFEVLPPDAAKAEYLKYFLDHEIGSCYERSRGIQWKTLEAWFKEQCENHSQLDLTLFKNYVGRKATVKGR